MSDEEHLAATIAVQKRLADAGFPSPTPILGPVPLGAGLATVETLLQRGEQRDASEPRTRAAMAAGLVELTRMAGVPPPGLRPGFLQRATELYPRPHHRRYDFQSTAAGAEWIDAKAAAALRVLREAAPPEVVGHNDWTTKHLRFDRGQIVAVYDWDSLGRAPEAVVAANASAHFTATWDMPVRRVWPTAADREAFLAEYESARGRVFTRKEWRVIRAAVAYQLAYTARVEHSVSTGPWPGDSCRQLLSELQ